MPRQWEKRDTGLLTFFLVMVAIVGIVEWFVTRQPVDDPHCPRHESGHYTVSHPRDCNEKN